MKFSNKLNFAKRIGLLAAAAIFTLSSCQKKENSVAPSAATSGYQQKDDDDAANKNNPYDYVGLRHNEILHATRGVWTDPAAKTDDVRTAVTNYVQQNYDPTAVPPPAADIDNNIPMLMSERANLGANLFANSNLSAQGKAYALKLSDALYNAPANSTYFDIRDAAIAVEDLISNDQQLSHSDKEMLLKMGSIGRYSMLYWLNEVNGANRGPSLEHAAAYRGAISSQMYTDIVVVSWVDFSSSTLVVIGRDWIYIETVTTFSAGVAIFYF